MKNWYNSKTIWSNFAVFSIAILSAMQQYAPMIEGQLDPAVYSWTLAGVGVMNMVLRKVTSTGIT